MPATPTRTRLAATGLATALALALAACGDDDADSASAEPEEVTVRDAWARPTAAGQTAGAAYMVLTGGTEDDRLVGAEVDGSVARTAEIHETMPAGGMGGGDAMTMREVDAVDVPAGEEVALEPGGYHVMLLGLAGPLEEGDTVEVDLELEHAGTIEVTAEVRDR
ncbi:MAG TPA: copper chaperone PCu(A)C [Acidimicrobiales bacterium]|nr:copper chaperone PCu(A)C [Acidimicrobiales bacterium]